MAHQYFSGRNSMVRKVGFICEGKSEAKIVLSESFQKILFSLSLECVAIVDAAGNKNLLPKYLPNHLLTMKKEQAVLVFIMTDLDEDVCITQTKERINENNYLPGTALVIVAVKEIESWFLADSET